MLTVAGEQERRAARCASLGCAMSSGGAKENSPGKSAPPGRVTRRSSTSSRGAGEATPAAASVVEPLQVRNPEASSLQPPGTPGRQRRTPRAARTGGPVLDCCSSGCRGVFLCQILARWRRNWLTLPTLLASVLAQPPAAEAHEEEEEPHTPPHSGITPLLTAPGAPRFVTRVSRVCRGAYCASSDSRPTPMHTRKRPLHAGRGQPLLQGARRKLSFG